MPADERAADRGRLAGTVALVTGASSGIGEASARSLAVEGASVAVVARRRNRLEALADSIGDPTRVEVIEADVTDEAQARAMVDRAVARFGRLDTLVNNAGVMLLGPIVDAPVEEWRRMVELNVLGLLYGTHAALPHLISAAEDGPRQVADVVNVSSVAGRFARRAMGSTAPPSSPWLPSVSPSARRLPPSTSGSPRSSPAPRPPSSPATTGPRSSRESATPSAPSKCSAPRTSPTPSCMPSPGRLMWP